MGKFVTQVGQFKTNTKSKLDKVLRRVSLDILRRLIIRSPVDTGRFRGNWQTSVGANKTNTLPGVDPSGSDTYAAGDAIIESSKFGDKIYIVNNLPYATRLEYGWSQQAPNGMVGITVAEYPSIVKNAVDAIK